MAREPERGVASGAVDGSPGRFSVATGPVAESDGSSAWTGRPALARCVRVGVTVVPVLASVVATALATKLVRRPASVGVLVAWWIGLLILGFAVLRLVDRGARRLLPLSTLLRLTLVFPDQAPSRLGVAMRSTSPKQLVALVERAHSDASLREPAHAAEEILTLLAALNAHDRRTRGHSDRVRAYTKLLADQLPLTGEQRDRLQWAAMLHDIGKLTVSPAILNKNGKPDADEWVVIKRHPAAAIPFLAPLREWLGDTWHAADQHHERWDGTGYPLGLAGEQISRAGRIVAVADAFEVMTAVRSYKRPMTAQAARQELARCAGTHFDPAIVRAFMSVSLGDLRTVMGPMSFLAQVPVLAGVHDLGQTFTNLLGPVARAAAAVTMAAGAVALTGAAPASSYAASDQPPPSTTVAADGTSSRALSAGRSGPSRSSPVPTTVRAAGAPGAVSAKVPGKGGTPAAPSPGTTAGHGAPAPTTGTTAPTSGAVPSPNTPTTRKSPTPTPAPEPQPTTPMTAPPPTTPTTINSAPVAQADAATAKKKATLLIPVLANDFDPNGNLDPLSVAITNGPTGPGNKMGTLTVVNVGGADEVNYKSPDKKGTFTFTYSVCDTYRTCATATVSVTLTD